MINAHLVSMIAVPFWVAFLAATMPAVTAVTVTLMALVVLSGALVPMTAVPSWIKACPNFELRLGNYRLVVS